MTSHADNASSLVAAGFATLLLGLVLLYGPQSGVGLLISLTLAKASNLLALTGLRNGIRAQRGDDVRTGIVWNSIILFLWLLFLINIILCW